ncbi:MAG: sulfate ABC transporter substrate-binding protein [Beijerinckiaceae bacterium]|nr:MAG: sulfate ABC transporter substrate-binding protein [Beijerinckiaceae bacterium]
MSFQSSFRSRFSNSVAIPATIIGALLSLPISAHAASVTITNVSYDPTRELYKDFNTAFAAYWKAKTGDTVTIRTSNGGSGAQARSVIDGLNADVVTLGIASDIDAIAKKTHKIPANWQKRLPNDSAPYTSTVVFLVRKGNPKHIGDWDDLVRPGVKVITPNPKTSSGARWNFLAAFAYALKVSGGNDAKARAFVRELYRNVPVLDSGARGATTTFVQRGQGDVLLAWENEAFLALNDLGRDKFEIVVPSYSVLAVPPVALVDGNADKDGTRKVSEAYLHYLYSPAGQKLIAHHYYRPFEMKYADPADARRFPKLALFKVSDVFGSWDAVQKKYFADGGVFDQIYGAGH